MNHANLPVAVHMFFLKDDKLFLIKRFNTGFMDGYWSVPAGRLDEHETITQAALREAREEVGANVAFEDLSKPFFMHHKDDRGERMYVFFLCSSWSGELKNLEQDKCDDAKWFGVTNLPDNIVPHIKYALQQMIDKNTFSEYGF